MARDTSQETRTSPQVYARTAGALYLVIIILGIGAEVFVRSSLVVPGDAAATVGNIKASESLFRLGFLGDSIVFLCDVAVAVLLYVLLKPVSKILALIAAAFRLTQTAVIAANLLNHYAALLLLNDVYASAFEPRQLDALVLLVLDVHSHGYDLGLLFFGVSCLVLGYLIAMSGYFPRALGYLVMLAGVAYLIGSYTLFLFPENAGLVAPIYVIPLVSEVALALWLLVKGVDVGEWDKRTQS